MGKDTDVALFGLCQSKQGKFYSHCLKVLLKYNSNKC